MTPPPPVQQQHLSTGSSWSGLFIKPGISADDCTLQLYLVSQWLTGTSSLCVVLSAISAMTAPSPHLFILLKRIESLALMAHTDQNHPQVCESFERLTNASQTIISYVPTRPSHLVNPRPNFCFFLPATSSSVLCSMQRSSGIDNLKCTMPCVLKDGS